MGPSRPLKIVESTIRQSRETLGSFVFIRKIIQRKPRHRFRWLQLLSPLTWRDIMHSSRRTATKWQTVVVVRVPNKTLYYIAYVIIYIIIYAPRAIEERSTGSRRLFVRDSCQGFGRFFFSDETSHCAVPLLRRDAASYRIESYNSWRLRFLVVKSPKNRIIDYVIVY